jgi:hypothetical protein
LHFPPLRCTVCHGVSPPCAAAHLRMDARPSPPPCPCPKRTLSCTLLTSLPQPVSTARGYSLKKKLYLDHTATQRSSESNTGKYHAVPSSEGWVRCEYVVGNASGYVRTLPGRYCREKDTCGHPAFHQSIMEPKGNQSWGARRPPTCARRAPPRLPTSPHTRDNHDLSTRNTKAGVHGAAAAQRWKAAWDRPGAAPATSKRTGVQACQSGGLASGRS